MNDSGTTSRLRRNLWIYSIAVIVIAVIGALIMAAGVMAGGLVLISGPILMNFVLRRFAGDGWMDAGLRFNLRASWRWYVFAIVAYPITQLFVLAFGRAVGLIGFETSLAALALATASLVVIQLPFHLTGAIGEELGWRGYMEPRLTALGVSPWRRAILVGCVWGLWHVPLILATPYTDEPLVLFFPLFFAGAIIASRVYGHMRQQSGTVWTSVILHGVGNAVLFSILGDGTALVFHAKLVAYFGLESLAVIFVWSLLALVFHNRARRRLSTSRL